MKAAVSIEVLQSLLLDTQLPFSAAALSIPHIELCPRKGTDANGLFNLQTDLMG